MPHPTQPAIGGLLAACLLAAAGCGGASVGQPSGKVTIKGKPVAGAEITFLPAASPDAVATGVSGEDGAYRLDYGGRRGVASGKCTVRITRYTLPNGKPLPGGEQGAALKADETKSVRHTYVFEKEVADGGQTLDFELSEGQKE